jgi:DNA-binding NtrC family response regulator
MIHYGKVLEMQLGPESSNRLKPTVDQQLINGAQLHGRTENQDSRLMQLDLMICGQSKVVRNLKKSILRAADCSSAVLNHR